MHWSLLGNQEINILTLLYVVLAYDNPPPQITTDWQPIVGSRSLRLESVSKFVRRADF
jgi:hypothetical protein